MKKKKVLALSLCMVLLMSACSSQSSSSTETEEPTTVAEEEQVEEIVEVEEMAVTDAVQLDTEVLVIGAGGAGLTAALTAAQGGADVLVIEKMAFAGGATIMAGGGTNATGSQWEKDFDVEDSPETYFMDIMKNGHYYSDARTLWMYANTQGQAFDWLVSEDGADLPYDKTNPSGSAEHSVTRTFSATGGGSGVITNLMVRVEDNDVEVMLETEATNLIVEDGVVTGAMAVGSDGTIYEIHADSVILATGGYGANPDLIPDDVAELPYAGAVAATGDGLLMAIAIGADCFNLDKVNIQPHSIVLPDGRGQHTYPGCLAVYNGTGGILVSDQGVRFISEQGLASEIKARMLENEHTYLIMDQDAFDAYSNASINAHNFSESQMEEWLEANGTMTPVFAHADTLEELAQIIDVPADALEETVETYNGFVDAGEDADFGRRVTGKLSEEGPYYAVEMSLRYYATLGGLHINDNMQVLDTAEQPIEGLYAAGEVVGGIVGDIYAPGSLFGWAMTSGHNAGLAVTGQKVWDAD